MPNIHKRTSFFSSQNSAMLMASAIFMAFYLRQCFNKLDLILKGTKHMLSNI